VPLLSSSPSAIALSQAALAPVPPIAVALAPVPPIAVALAPVSTIAVALAPVPPIAVAVDAPLPPAALPLPPVVLPADVESPSLLSSFTSPLAPSRILHEASAGSDKATSILEWFHPHLRSVGDKKSAETIPVRTFGCCGIAALDQGVRDGTIQPHNGYILIRRDEPERPEWRSLWSLFRLEPRRRVPGVGLHAKVFKVKRLIPDMIIDGAIVSYRPATSKAEDLPRKLCNCWLPVLPSNRPEWTQLLEYIYWDYTDFDRRKASVSICGPAFRDGDGTDARVTVRVAKSTLKVKARAAGFFLQPGL
jgi:hypothetical protein